MRPMSKLRDSHRDLQTYCAVPRDQTDSGLSSIYK